MGDNFFEDLPELFESISDAKKEGVNVGWVIVWIIAIILIIAIITW